MNVSRETGSGGRLVDLCKLGNGRDAFGKLGQQLLRRVKGLSKRRRQEVKVGEGSAATWSEHRNFTLKTIRHELLL